MNLDIIAQYLAPVIEVFLIDLLLSGDNAVVIGLACRSLDPVSRRKAIIFGTWAAILMRIGLTLVIASLLAIPGLKLVGGAALTLIAIRLLVVEDEGAPDALASDGVDAKPQGIVTAVGIVVIADFVMSLDNVVALAAVAQNNAGILVFGLLLSIPLLMFGGFAISGLLERFPILIVAGGALLGWISGDIAMSDPLIASWASTQSPFLVPTMPWLIAAFVILQARFINEEQQKRRLAASQSPRREA